MTNAAKIATAVDATLSEADGPSDSPTIETNFSSPTGETVSRVFTFSTGDELEARMVVDWAAVERQVTADDVARVVRVALAATAKPFYEGRPVALLLSGSDPDEETAKTAFANRARILVAKPVPAELRGDSHFQGTAFAYRRPSVSKTRIEVEDPRALSAQVSKHLQLTLTEDTEVPRFVGAMRDRLVSLDALEGALPLDGDGKHRSYAFPIREVVLHGGEKLAVREVVFQYRVEWRPLRGQDPAAALADFVSRWVFG